MNQDLPLDNPSVPAPNPQAGPGNDDFENQYRLRQTLAFTGAGTPLTLEYIQVIPPVTNGKRIFLAVGVPWNWNLSRSLVASFFAAGYTVFAVNHPRYVGLRAACRYCPDRDRPAALEALFTHHRLTDCLVVAHSVGFIDIMQKGKAGIAGIVALNPAGLSKNNIVNHSLNALQSIQKGKKYKEPGARRCYREFLNEFYAQHPLKSVKDVWYASMSDVRDHIRQFAGTPIIIMRNNEDTLVPVSQAYETEYWPLPGAGNHLGPFIYEDQQKEVRRAFERLNTAKDILFK